MDEELAELIRQKYPKATRFQITVTNTEHWIEVQSYNGNGEHSMRNISGRWCGEETQ